MLILLASRAAAKMRPANRVRLPNTRRARSSRPKIQRVLPARVTRPTLMIRRAARERVARAAKEEAVRPHLAPREAKAAHLLVTKRMPTTLLMIPKAVKALAKEVKEREDPTASL